jgi:hypothetical protein
VKTEIDFLRELEDDLERAARGAVSPVRLRSPARRPGKVAIAGMAAAFLVVAGVVGYWFRSNAGPNAGQRIGTAVRFAGRMPPAPQAPQPPQQYGPANGASLSVDSPAWTATPGAQDSVSAGTPANSTGVSGRLPLVGPQIVKTARLSLTVKKGGFDDAFRQASLVASKYGGFVDSSSAQGGTTAKSGSVEVRVPSQSFERALADLGALGTVDGESVSGDDVSSQYVDLQARIKAWEAQESVLLGLMSKATTVQDTLRVQTNLQDVQLEIERLKGQLRVLQDQTDNATIAVSMREAGALVIKQQQRSTPWLPSFRKAWHDAAGGLLSVLFAVLVGLGYLVPITLLGLAAWFGYRRLRFA